MHRMAYDELLGIDILAPLGLTLTLNGTRIFPPSRKNRETCATEGPMPMDSLKPGERRRVEEFPKAQMERLLNSLCVTPLIEHEIRLEDPTPIRQRYRPRNLPTQNIIDEEADKMLREGVIQPSNSPWSSPIVIAHRKDGKPRFCVDLRRRNKVSEKDTYPLPQVNVTLDKLRGARYLSTVDLKNGYWHVPLTDRRKPLTTFTLPGKGLFKFKVMPFGLHAIASTFQRLLDQVITPDIAPDAFAYLDDIVVCTQTLEEHVDVFRNVFQKLQTPEKKSQMGMDRGPLGNFRRAKAEAHDRSRINLPKLDQTNGFSDQRQYGWRCSGALSTRRRGGTYHRICKLLPVKNGAKLLSYRA